MSSTAGAIAGPSRRRSDHEEEEEDIVEDHDSKIVHTNQPFLITVFRDPDSGDHKVALVVALPGGATNVEISLLGGNAGSSTAIVTYSWPPIMFNIEAMFASSIKYEDLGCILILMLLRNSLEIIETALTQPPKVLCKLHCRLQYRQHKIRLFLKVANLQMVS